MQGNEASTDVRGRMKAEVYNAALCGSFEEVSGVSNWKDSETFNKNNILHVHVGKPLHKKAKKGLVCMDFLKKVLNDEGGYSLLWKVNNNGDTPLHLAARFGHADAVEAFLERAQEVNQEEEVTRMLKMTNKKKDTALHEAARVGHAAVVKLLAEFVCPYEPNEEGETPLYLAAERGSTPSVLSILDTGNPSALANIICKGPGGRTALHAAVQWGSSVMVERLLKKESSLLKIQNDEGLTPFHSVASEIYKSNLLKILVEYDSKTESSAMYIQDNEGRSALHIAMLRCNWKAIQDLIDSCPDIIEIVDKKGQNMAHYAAKWSCLYQLYKLLSTGHLDKLINDKDVDGNTPLHLLANFDEYYIQNKDNQNKDDQITDNQNKDNQDQLHFCLNRLPLITEKYPFIDIKAYNKSNQTIGDILLGHEKLLKEERINMGPTPRGRRMNAYERDLEIAKTSFDNDTLGEWNAKSLKDTANSRIVVAALIATVSFTAGFTLPGGFDQNKGENIGMAVLKGSALFKVFLVSDAIAFTTSTVAIVLYFMLVAQDAKWANKCLSFFALLMNTVSLGALMIAFLTGVCAVLSKSHGLIMVICLTSIPFFVGYRRLIHRTIQAGMTLNFQESSKIQNRLVHQ